MKNNIKCILATGIIVLLSTAVVRGYDRNFTEIDTKSGIKAGFSRNFTTEDFVTVCHKYFYSGSDYAKKHIEDTTNTNYTENEDNIEGNEEQNEELQYNAEPESSMAYDRITSVNTEVDAVLEKKQSSDAS